MNIAILGGGSWGTAISRLLSNKGYNIKFYVRNNDTVLDINNNHRNSKYLPNIEIKNVKASSNLNECINDTEIIIMAVPSHSFRKVLIEVKKKVGNQIIVNLSKGIEIDSLKRMSEISKEILPNNSYVCLSGPSHAEEVGLDIPTTVTVASEDINAAKTIQKIFATDNFRVYTNSDLIGVEIGGALKNIIALAAGMSDGLKYGDNTKAALVTRGIYEMSKLGMALGANPQTFNGLSGIGDLIVTCTSMHSRNRRAGILIGEGNSSEEACKIVGQVVEGIKTTKSAYELSKKYNVNMPITHKLYEVLYSGLDPREAVLNLMTREYKEEIEEIFFN
ncbi:MULTISPECIES: NAD(P)H-dependent glycerol-3-phosphate dehydrogenase [Peptoniphilus]|uniref:NAD(P)H-dependent glycerol-3-phosphate dehydrogenase n=1 Tax=Peptoniphilus TaxID=162289 RepID=UPI0001DA9B41|nr:MULTISPECIES: NAD(P)H-dependent glycerol-3-phosphate dehydrogenase [Peptoniphilus]EFI42314.1 putative glycerol-3-phosphate dehydrogenase [NAD(P)+] [Peptoniphilus sp. oral taxon 386 str. F0131]